MNSVVIGSGFGCFFFLAACIIFLIPFFKKETNEK